MPVAALLLGLAMLTCVPAGMAADVARLDAEYESRIARLEAQLASLQQESGESVLTEVGQHGVALDAGPACHSGACGTSGCDAGCGLEIDCGRCQPSGFYGGAEVVFAKIYQKESFRAAVADVATGTQNLLPYEFDYNATPRVWIGYTDPCGTGVRGRYWQLDEDQGPENFVADGRYFPSAQQVTLILPAAIATTAPGQVLTVSSGIELETIDVEGTFRFNGWGNRFLASAGLQYAKIDQYYRSAIPANQQILNWDRSLEGFGPTMGIEFARPVGCHGFEFFGSARGAMIFAEKNLTRLAVNAVPMNSGPPLPNTTYNDADELLVTGQMQLGVQWTRPLCRGGELFVRGTYEGQIWTDAGGNALGYLGVEGFGLSVGVSK